MATATGKKDMVRVRYIPTTDSYRNIILSSSISNRQGVRESIRMRPGDVQTMSRDLALHLQAKAAKTKKGTVVRDGSDLERRMTTGETDGGRRVEVNPDFEIIIEGE